MDIDPQKLRYDRVDAAMVAINAENRLRRLVNTMGLIVSIGSLDMDLTEYREATRIFGQALDSLIDLNTKARELGVQL